MTDQSPATASSSTTSAAASQSSGARTFFAWHPVYQGRDVESVRRDIADELRRDQRAYELALRAAELDESASLQTVLKLDDHWSPFDLGWAEADVPQLTDYVVAIELERDRQQRMARPKELSDRVAPPAIDHAGPDADDEMPARGLGAPRWLVFVIAVVIFLLITILINSLM